MSESMTTERIIMLLLAAVIAAYLLVALIGVSACLYYHNECNHVDFRYYLGEPLSALLGLLGGRILGNNRP